MVKKCNRISKPGVSSNARFNVIYEKLIAMIIKINMVGGFVGRLIYICVCRHVSYKMFNVQNIYECSKKEIIVGR